MKTPALPSDASQAGDETLGLDVAASRRRIGYSRGEYAARVAWSFGRVLFRCSPRIAFGYRNAILRLFGAKIGRGVRFYPSAVVYLPWMLEIGDGAAVGENALIYCLGPVKIGGGTIISQRVHLCAGTHDYRDPSFALIRSGIEIGSDVWVCADAFVGPNVRIGDRAIAAARAVVVKDCEAGMIYAGNPARAIKPRDAMRSPIGSDPVQPSGQPPAAGS